MLRLLALAVLLSLTASASAQTLPDREIPFQGALEDGGAPVTAPTSVTFSLFEAASGGSAIWTETQAVTPDADGVFAVRLGAGTTLPGDLGGPLWLEVAVPSGGGSQVLGPRTELGAAPYALGLYGLTVTPNASGTSATYGPNLVGGSPANTVGSGVGGATISGGGGTNNRNRVTADFGAVGGGSDNTASGFTATVGGGQDNTAGDNYSTVGGGFGNTASGTESTVGGGVSNRASGDRSTAGGGQFNTASGFAATLGGGRLNTASGFLSTVPGGESNFATGSYSFAAGHYARAVHQGAFVWSDDSRAPADPLVSTGPRQFLVRAAGGVGIGTNDPTTQFDVARTISGNGNFPASHVAHLRNASTSSSPDVLALSVGTVTPGGGVNYIGFFADGGATLVGQIEGNGAGGVVFNTSGADYAEYLPLAASVAPEAVQPGDLVGLRGGTVSLAAAGAEQVMVASSNAAVAGNAGATEGGALVAFVGQAEVRLAGTASVGDLLVASGLDDGTARAVAPETYRPEADGPVAGRVVALPEAGRAVALVGVDEAAALRAVVARQTAEIKAQAAQIEALQADRDADRARLDALARRLDALTASGPPVSGR
ncbi:MAG: hypothetical protein AAF845_01260 [Bacteroidota bacterium]